MGDPSDGRTHILGIDVGSATVALVEIDRGGRILRTDYRFHNGDVVESLVASLGEIDFGGIEGVAATGSTPVSVLADRRYDDKVSVIAAAARLHPEFSSILLVGAEKFGVLQFDGEGHYRRYRTNTSCAAGTGSFLDQQAARLRLSSAEELADRALSNTEDTPGIASRCAVFAKTDLIHAQQEGFGLEAICDGLCRCLARNLVDTLFGSERPEGPVVFCGGVSRNRAVVNHVKDLLGVEVRAGEHSHLYGAIGAALSLLEEGIGEEPLRPSAPEDLLNRGWERRKYGHPPLRLVSSSYPDFEDHERYEFSPVRVKGHPPVEVDLYDPESAAGDRDLYLGIDIGSTSTKAVLLDAGGMVLAGFYTRTSGKPVIATQALLEAMEDLAGRLGFEPRIAAAGTTGSGRKFIGKIVGADLVLDEISAHARAAAELDPEVDTIIEIGGQDSKFTTLHNGMVTSAVMNHVCAAGTGSFIEEQARRLGCSLTEISDRTDGVEAPLSSDRCTVFMERDVNHLLAGGYSPDEVLASVLHSVRENYLIKVANEREIGEVVYFQGATAKIRSLAAAFEQRLERPILVSRYCHLTGALGVALTLAEMEIPRSRFRGLDLYDREIPVRFETCELCSNTCKITVADLRERPEAYGFLCGRDYDSEGYVNGDRSGFNLLKERKQALAFDREACGSSEITVGIPAALHLVEDMSFWGVFFNRLGIRTVSSESCKDPLTAGRHISGAEFCAPVTALYGHVNHLLSRTDFVFLPFYLENKAESKGAKRKYCYYTQFTPSLVSGLEEIDEERILTPIVRSLYPDVYTIRQLYRMLREDMGLAVNPLQVVTAYEKAKRHGADARARLRDVFTGKAGASDDISVVLLGRPYTVLSPSLNHGIPSIFGSLGVTAFYQDMLSYSEEDLEAIEPLLDEIHWNFASKILESAEVVAGMEGVYPVLITSFRCSPDSFAVAYFKSMMHARGKPYLILELDVHDSRVGYETRIEAAVRAFRNHRTMERRSFDNGSASINPELETKIGNRTVLFPNWDPVTCRLLVATLRREGFEAQLLRETEGSIQRSLSYNTGQCIPLNAVAQSFMEHVREKDMDPGNTLLWMIQADLSCNLQLYPHHMKTLMEVYGKGMDRTRVYVGKISFADISPRASMNAYLSYLFGGMLRRMACRVRPYETEAGAADRAAGEGLALFERVILGELPRDEAVIQVVDLFLAIPKKEGRRMKVAVFGDLYTRDNDVMNQGLERFVEAHGGEVVTTPYSHHARMVAQAYFQRWFAEWKFGRLLWNKALVATMQTLERGLYLHFEKVTGEPYEVYEDPPEEILSDYRVFTDHSGESMENLLWAHYTRKRHPDLALFVQASPAFCCPAMVTEAMRERIEHHTGVPVVSITYDGTGGNKNEAIVPYLKFPRVRESR